MNFIRMRQAITNRLVPNANNHRLIVGKKPAITAFTPLALFASGAQGAWYDFSDMSTLFQDNLGTVPVTAVGQPVGRVIDQGPNGWDLVQATAGKRPVYILDADGKHGLNFDRTLSQCLNSAAQGMGASFDMFISAGVRKEANVGRGHVAEYSPTTASNNGTFDLRSPSQMADDTPSFFSRGTAGTQALAAGYVSPIKLILTGIGRNTTSHPLVAVRVNGVLKQSVTTSQGTGPYGNFALFVGSRNDTSEFFNGNMYGLVVCAKQASAGEIALTENFLNTLTGAY